jgi:hypothetical protein
MQKERTAPMAQIVSAEKQTLEIAHILQKHMADYKRQYPLWPEHKKVVADLLNCRTPALGGRIERCDTCGVLRIIYHSCRNRHCPKCQHMPREQWLAKRKDEILPATYYHVVFTLPHELNPVILKNKKAMLDCLFAAASKTLLSFAKNEFGGKAGFLAILHTWDQKLNAHFHLHCLVAGGVVADDTTRWIECSRGYLFNQRALSLVFRGKFMALMGLARKCEKLKCEEKWYRSVKNTLFGKTWVVSVRDPVKRAEHVLEYLARYTHRVAIANSRIKAIKDNAVTFTAKNRKEHRIEQVTVSAVEFIRRFLLHSLPKGFVRIRHYGFLANRNRKSNVAIIKCLLGCTPSVQQSVTGLEQMMFGLTGIDITTCPCCKKGKMRLVLEIFIRRARSPTHLIGCAD